MKSWLKGCIFVVVCMVALGTSFFWRDIRSGQAPSGQALAGLIGKAEPEKPTPTQVFRQAFNLILQDCYKPVERQDLKYSGMEGLMASLEDPHTMYLEPKVAEAFVVETSGNFVGVGARLAPDPLGAKVMQVFKDGPAAKAGLLPGDLIISVDRVSSNGQQIDVIVDSIRGKEGTVVEIQVVRTNEPKPLKLKITRQRVITPSVDAKPIPKTPYGYIAISSFSQPTTTQFDEALDNLEARGLQGLIIDLRGNGGGLLETAVEMLSRFVSKKMVVKIVGRKGQQDVVYSYGGLLRKSRYPLIVLINEESASASEIFAGVLRDYKLATLVGEHTYGKNSVQEVLRAPEGSAKITVARYHIPSGQDFARREDPDQVYLSGGLQPDILVELQLEVKIKDPKNPKALKEVPVVIGDPETDNQLQKAIEILRSKSARHARATFEKELSGIIR